MGFTCTGAYWQPFGCKAGARVWRTDYCHQHRANDHNCCLHKAFLKLKLPATFIIGILNINPGKCWRYQITSGNKTGMQLSKFTDYALRILMHLAVADKHMLTTRQIAEIHDAKYNHLAKVTQWLVRKGYVASVRGRSGGLRLAKETNDVNVGLVVRDLEGQSELVDCLRPSGGSCILAPSCGLTAALRAAQEAFFQSLDTLTLADLTKNDAPISRLLARLNIE